MDRFTVYLVDDDAGSGDVFALGERLAQHGCSAAGSRLLADGITGIAWGEPAVCIAYRRLIDLHHVTLHAVA